MADTADPSDDTPTPPPEPVADDDTSTRILRRAPLTGPQPLSRPAESSAPGHQPTTGDILRRHPTGAQPIHHEPVTQIVPVAPYTAEFGSRAQPTAVGPARSARVDPTAAIATAVLSILSGWATGVIATDLITGWWATDPLFCVAMGFLTAVSAAASISGVIALLLRRRTARLLIVVGAVIALLIFASLFVAGATLPALVYVLPVLPAAAIVCAVLPGTARWSRTD
ncbi:hypothetical protein FHR72_002426 [Mycolicibacterium iranicum]|uniref:Uncharacterized protein n=1 Tax=Mycolicibacterium iranicum TaxID=912594 RepID=A0A839Q649_MYCIR|nr:hypothetical protein [Mycolicibacterium iranicum]MBB2990953.1 hypothetical protein [Mycolicibacterium iranicum]